MPAVVNFVKINSVSESSMFQAGDAFWFSPENETLIIAGPGSYNVGDGLQTISKINFYFNEDFST